MNELKNFYDAVAKVAYNLYEKGGRVHGQDMEDWFKAEMIVEKRYEKREWDGRPGWSNRPTEKSRQKRQSQRS